MDWLIPVYATIEQEEFMATQTQSQVANIANEKVSVGQSLTALALRRLRRDYLTLVAMAVIFVLALLAIFAPFIEKEVLNVSYTSTKEAAFLPPGTPGHILGTDDLGRDHFIRLLYAGQVSLGIAFSAAVLSLVIGVGLGVITGYYGGIVDDVATNFYNS